MGIQISVSAIPFDPDHLEKMIKREYLLDTMKHVLNSREYRVILDYFFSADIGEQIGADELFRTSYRPNGIGRSRVSQIKSDAIRKLNWKMFEDARKTCEHSETLDILK